MRKFIGLFVIAATIIDLIYRDHKESAKKKREFSYEQHEGFTVTRAPIDGQHEVVRFRGSYDDIMRSFGIVKDEKPPLPEGLDIEALPKYWGGCPHCGTMSMIGENMWRYQELSRTRGYMDNTTTYLAKCKKCEGFMRATVDHDD